MAIHRFLVAITLGVLAIGGCRAFVDLEGLGGGAAPDDGAGLDATTEDGSLVDAGTDAKGVSDVGPPDVVSPDVDAAAPACPSKGGPSVRIPAPDGGTFCIDATEVTRGEYAAFLATNPVAANQIALCQWNTTFVPADPAPAPADLTKPAGVNWCDAYAFCKWAGKRLCGKVGGGGALLPGAAPTLASEYYFVCSASGTRIYPYGDIYNANSCNGGEANAGLENVKSRPGCEGGFKGVFDLAGNTHQWLDSCVIGADPATDSCVVTNSAYDGHPAGDMPCTQMNAAPRNQIGTPHGFRCCAD